MEISNTLLLFLILVSVALSIAALVIRGPKGKVGPVGAASKAIGTQGPKGDPGPPGTMFVACAPTGGSCDGNIPTSLTVDGGLIVKSGATFDGDVTVGNGNTWTSAGVINTGGRITSPSVYTKLIVVPTPTTSMPASWDVNGIIVDKLNVNGPVVVDSPDGDITTSGDIKTSGNLTTGGSLTLGSPTNSWSQSSGLHLAGNLHMNGWAYFTGAESQVHIGNQGINLVQGSLWTYPSEHLDGVRVITSECYPNAGGGPLC